jgi:hypothetical protein
MNRFFRPILTLGALIALPLTAQPAAADDGRRHVMTPLQKIDLVRDLPDEPAFEKDDQYFDLGYIYPIRTVNGASVASTGGEAGYVLYRDDKYMRVDAALMAELRYVLGEDPTQGYTPPTPSSSRASVPGADPWGADADKARGQPIAPPPAHRSSARAGSIFAAVFFMFLMLFVRVRIFRDLVIGGILAAIASVVRRSDPSDFSPSPSTPNQDFGAQAAAQRARLDALSGGSASSPNATPGGFGRKVV